MMRVCHDTCPVGVATQDPSCGRIFTGQGGSIVNFSGSARRKARDMAALGFRTVDEMIDAWTASIVRPTR